MKRAVLIGLNLCFFAQALLVSCLYASCFLPLYLVATIGFLRWRPDRAGRVLNWIYGRCMIHGTWPFLRLSRRGAERVPDAPCVAVVNHRSFTDVFFMTLFPRPDLVVVVRGWPFAIPVLGPFMRLAGYLDVERLSPEELLVRCGELARRGASFLFFPEGHRSRDGRIQRFHSGAFRVAAEWGLPVVPVLLTGTERLGRGAGLMHPARVHAEILSALHPGAYGGEKSALRLRRHAEALFRHRLDGGPPPGAVRADSDDEGA